MHPRIDLYALAAGLDVELESALDALRSFYRELDANQARLTSGLALPCHAGCDACCHESVFLTPLEFLLVWDHVQRELDDETRGRIVDRGLELFQRHRDLIEAFDLPPPAGEADHGALARSLRFTCPLLGDGGRCLVYPARELYARLFGGSFNDEGGVYGCELVGAHLGGRTVTLLKARAVAQALSELPLTFKRQVYPYYLALLYGGPVVAR